MATPWVPDELLIEATDGFEDVQVAEAVRFDVDPS